MRGPAKLARWFVDVREPGVSDIVVGLPEQPSGITLN